MKHIRRDYSHIKYTWFDGGYFCSITLHRLDHNLALHNIPQDARQTPMTYYYDRFDVLHWKEVR